MKNFILTLCFLITGIPLCSGGIQLEKGAVYHFRSSLFMEEQRYYKEDQQSNREEALERYTWEMKVLEHSGGQYKILLKEIMYDHYRRLKQEDGDWYSINWYTKALQSDTTENFRPRHSGRTRFTDSALIIFSPDKNRIKIRYFDSLMFNKSRFPEKMWSYIIQRYESAFNSFIINLPKDLHVNDTFNNFGTTYQIKEINADNCILNKVNKQEGTFVSEHRVDTKSGLVLEVYDYSKFEEDYETIQTSGYLGEKEVSVHKLPETIMRTNLVVTNTKPYQCKFKESNETKDTIFQETNVTIRGRIKNAEPNKPVILWWGEQSYNGYIWKNIITDLDENNEFEIRMKMEDVMKVNLKHKKEEARFYISPGDDVFIDLDYNNFDESITCSGAGSNSINYTFDRLRFDEENGIGVSVLNKYDSKLNVELDTKSFEEHYTTILNQKTSFLQQWKHKMAPEVYLAEYWLYTFKIADILNGYIDKSYIKNVNEGTDKDGNKVIRGVSYKNNSPHHPIKVGHLIHPDNALMAFSVDYDWFLYSYTLSNIYYKSSEITGVIRFYTPDNENRVANQYNFFNSYFTGKNAYALKYKTVCDAFKNSDWETTNTLYERFINEYPKAKETDQLKRDFTKIKAIAPGQQVYDFELEDLKGKKVKLSHFRGKALYIIFMSNFIHTKHMNMIYERHADRLHDLVKDKNAEIIYVSLDDSIETAKAYFGEKQFKGTMLFAGKEKEKIKEMFSLNWAPHYLIIDVEGKIAYKDAPSPGNIINSPELLLKACKPLFPENKSAKTIFILKLVSLGLFLFIVITLIIVIAGKRRARQKQRLTNLNAKVRELELTAIRAQMNPHFMHNCLNSIQNLVQKNQTEEAHLYISKFASFIRMVLKNSDKEEIALAEELEMIQQYVELEQLRFPIDFNIDIAKNIEPYSVFIPPLLMQPLVENAIVHGLSGKEGDKTLQIKIETKNNRICTSIIDNGIGINNEKTLNPLSTGKGLSFTRERLELLSEKYSTQYHMEVTNVQTDARVNRGTRVEISFFED